MVGEKKNVDYVEMRNVIMRKHRIVCAGRYAGEFYPCEYDFSTMKGWSTKELREHEKLEEKIDNKYDFWLGFEYDKKYEEFIDRVHKVKKDEEEIF